MAEAARRAEARVEMLLLGPGELDLLYPAHLRVDGAGRIVGMGPSLARRTGGALLGSPFFDCVAVERPASVRDLVALARKSRSLIIRLLRPPQLRLRGLAIHRAGTTFLLVGHVAELGAAGPSALRFDDFSPADSAPDLLFEAELRTALQQED